MRALVPPVLLLCALAAVVAARATWVGAEEPEAESDPVPLDNTAYVPADAKWLRQAWERAEKAIAGGDWDTAVRRLQRIADVRVDPEDAGAAAPFVLPVSGKVVYEGAWIVAHHRILEGGAPALNAYAEAFGGEAEALLARGVRGRNPADLAEAADRFLPLPAGRRAALMLADLALEQGDRDTALGWLERLADVEEVSREPAASLVPWRHARLPREAAALARPERITAVQAFLARAAVAPAAGAERFAPVPLADRPLAVLNADWPTTGGTPSRDGVPSEAGTSYALDWWDPLYDEGYDLGNLEPEARRPRGPRPSPWMPQRAVVAWPLAFASDGARLHAWDLRTGFIAARPHALSDRGALTLPWEDRRNLGLLEGFGLTLGPLTAEGRLIYAAIPDLLEGEAGWDYDTYRDDAIGAYLWDGRKFHDVWRAGGRWASEGIPSGTRLYGAPLLYRDRIWVAGLRGATEVKAEAWLYALDPATGAVRTRTFLGTGGPPRVRRADEAIPSSPAGRAGRVVVVTNLGIVAAVDARSGRPVWTYLNDRAVASAGRPPYRLGTGPDGSARESGFVNQPPLLALERVFVAPTDGPFLLSLFDRPRGRKRLLVSHRRHRSKQFHAFTAEQIAGLSRGGEDSPPLLVVVGKGAAEEGAPPAPLAIGLDPETLAPRSWRAFATSGHGAEPYGLAVVTAGEVLIPTRHGIGIYALSDGRDLATLDEAAIPPKLREVLPPASPMYGNLVPVPGRGVFVVNGSVGAFWKVR